MIQSSKYINGHNYVNHLMALEKYKTKGHTLKIHKNKYHNISKRSCDGDFSVKGFSTDGTAFLRTLQRLHH